MYHYVRQIKQKVIFNRSHMLEVLRAVLLQNLWRLITYQNRNRHIIRHIYGGFQLVDLIITEFKDHMTCCKFECSHWWKTYL